MNMQPDYGKSQQSILLKIPRASASCRLIHVEHQGIVSTLDFNCYP